MAGKLENKVAIVTAGGSGIGAATVRRFAREGAAVVIADLSGSRAEQVRAEVAGSGGRAATIKMDVADPQAVEATIKLALDSFGRLDVLFNNAGMAEVSLIHETTLASWERVMAVTLTGTFLGLKYAIPIMRKQGGLECAGDCFLALARANGIADRDNNLVTTLQPSQELCCRPASSIIEPIAKPRRGEESGDRTRSGKAAVKHRSCNEAETKAICRACRDHDAVECCE